VLAEVKGFDAFVIKNKPAGKVDDVSSPIDFSILSRLLPSCG
jgi:hypothetical protein